MFNNLVTYHVHKHDHLPGNNALAYQYILAGNGVFVRAETRFFTALLPVTACTVRGLKPLSHSFHLHVPRMPARLLDTILSDARRARRPDEGRSTNGLNEVLYQFHHHGQTVHVKNRPNKQRPFLFWRREVMRPTSFAICIRMAICLLFSVRRMTLMSRRRNYTPSSAN